MVRQRNGSDKADRRVVLCVDNDGAAAESIRRTWSQLRLAEELHVIPDHEQALDFIHNAQETHEAPTVAAVILDPDATGEQTGEFLRQVRGLCDGASTPVVFWTQDGETYQVLEGLGVEAVHTKPMVLRLITALDGACNLRVQQPAQPTHPLLYD